MSAGKKIAIGLGCGCLTLGALLVGLVGMGIWSAQPPKNVTIDIAYPPEVAVGESFAFEVRVTDTSGSKRLLDSIDLADELLPGFSIRSTDPPYRGTVHVPMDNTVSYDLQTEIPANGSVTVRFQAVGERAGEWSGDFDVCVDGTASFIPKPVRIRVR